MHVLEQGPQGKRSSSPARRGSLSHACRGARPVLASALSRFVSSSLRVVVRPLGTSEPCRRLAVSLVGSLARSPLDDEPGLLAHWPEQRRASVCLLIRLRLFACNFHLQPTTIPHFLSIRHRDGFLPGFYARRSRFASGSGHRDQSITPFDRRQASGRLLGGCFCLPCPAAGRATICAPYFSFLDSELDCFWHAHLRYCILHTPAFQTCLRKQQSPIPPGRSHVTGPRTRIWSRWHLLRQGKDTKPYSPVSTISTRP